MKENGFTLKKARSRRYLEETIRDADYADDVELLANTQKKAESRLHCLEHAAGGIGLHVNADKTEYVFYSKMRYLHTKWWFYDISGQIHVPQ